MPNQLTEEGKLRTQNTKSVLPHGNGEWILVVDDEASICEVAQRILVKYGYQVLTARDGAEALAVYGGEDGSKIQLVITDMLMPRMEGMSLIRTLQKINQDVRIIASSGLTQMSGESERDNELRSLGIRLFLDKPFTAESLLESVHRQLGRARAD